MHVSRSVLGSYRSLLRAVETAFRGDHRMLSAARLRVRDEFRKEKNAEDPSLTIQQRITLSDEAADYLLKNVVQATHKANGCLRT